MAREPLSKFDERVRKVIAQNLKRLTDLNELTQAELSSAVNIPASTLSGYFAERSTISAGNLQKLADYFNVDKGDIDERYKSNKNNLDFSNIDNLIPLNKINKIPVVGSIAAGKPRLATEDIEAYVMLDSTYKADFALRVSGDSMIEAGINDGDLALIKRDLCIENGEICAVSIDGHATLKRLYRNDDFLTLQPCNSKYQPIIVKENDEPYIVGKLTGIVRKY